jgi:hypothetical protein
MKWAAAAACFVAGLVPCIGVYVAERVFPISCPVAPISENWSSDHVYRAILLEKDCGEGEDFSYSLRLEKGTDREGTLSDGWYFVWEIENDKSGGEPSVRWETPLLLRLEVPTNRLSGRLESHLHDFTLVRTFLPAPQAGDAARH